MNHDIADQVPRDNPGAREIGFSLPERYNASRILFDNIAHGRGERLALTGPGGTRTYAQLCAEASQWGHGLQSLGLKRGDRILMFLDDTPAYPAAFGLRAAPDQYADAAGPPAILSGGRRRCRRGCRSRVCAAIQS
jgi:non-ribosomal peptide synthetase component F